MNENIVYLLNECLQPLILQYLETCRKLAKYSFMPILRQTAEIFLDFKQVGILISKFAYAIIAVGKRDCKSMWTKKSEALSTANTGGFFLFIYSGQETTRLVLPYLSPSNHLMMKWQATPAMQETRKEIAISMWFTSSRCRVSVGQHI